MTNSEKLRATGAAIDGDWVGDDSIELLGDITFARDPARSNGKLHLAVMEPWQMSALCGVTIETEGQTTFDSLVDRDLCPKCLREIRKLRA